jgi:hypothetical protein
LLIILDWRPPVSVNDFHQFVLGLEEKSVEVTNATISGLSLLCDKFGFWSLCSAFSVFQGVLMEEAEARQSQTAAFTFQRNPWEWK